MRRCDFCGCETAKANGLLTLKRQDHEFDSEIRSHLHMLTERYLCQGMSRDEAARAARLQFGNVTLLKEKQNAQRSRKQSSG